MHLSFLCAMLIVSNSQCRSTGLQQKVLVLDLTLKAKSLLTSLSHSNKEFYECMACIFSYNWYHCCQKNVCMLFILYTGKSSLEVKIEADSNDMTERPYLCVVCDERFTTKASLKVHKVIHAGDQLYSCTECDKQFTHLRYLSTHKNIHKKKYKCTECGKCFHGNQELTIHIRSHSGEKPFECFVCNKRFAQATNLIKHCRIHTGEKRYKCSLCDKAFSQSGHLNIHMRVHTGDKPYKCSLCDKSFYCSSHLQRHERSTHKSR